VIHSNPVNNVTKKWIPELKSYCPNVPILLVGTKIDLRADAKLKKLVAEKWKPMVTYDEGLKLSKEIEALGYIEISAKKLRGVEELMMVAARISAGGFSLKKERGKCIVQ
jgi:GTPase SAR1 family protein